LASTALGAFGFVGVGTIFAALTASVRARESLLPILLLPVMVPVFMAGVAATAGVLDGGGLAEIANWLWLLVGFDVVFLVVAYLLFDLILEEV
jgi:heme exporter protein B